jgi:valyl-tRNA synthetase
VAEGAVAAILRSGEAFIKALTNSESLTIAAEVDRPSESAVAVLADAEILLPLEGLIDKEAELARLRKSLTDLNKQKSATESKLANEGFTSRAPAEVVENLRSKQAELISQIASVESAMKALGG